MTEPCDLPAVAARALIGRKALSPVELLESCIARIDATDHAVNAMVARDLDGARRAARAAEAAVMAGGTLGALHGLPVGVKDLEDVAGLRTTYGSTLFADHVPHADDGIVAAIRAAGGIVLGKTNTPEWGAGANTRNAVYGATGNPFDPTRSAAGSSGGSAVALATGMVPLATGSDTGGSLRNPAAYCGVVGFRPSPGVVPSEKRGLGWSPLPVLGPMARDVPDLCLLLSAIATADGRDPLAPVEPPGPRLLQPAPLDLGTLRVAVTPDFGFAPTSAAVRALFAERVGRMRSWFGAADDDSPDCTGTDEAFEVLRALSFLHAHGTRAARHPDQVGPNVRANVAEGERYTAADVARAMGLQTQIFRGWQGFMSRVDLVISPAMTLPPPPWSQLFPAQIDGVPTRTYFHWLALPYAVTLVGHPAICLPCGRDADGMPFGIQVVGRRGGDAALLAAAAALEQAMQADPALRRPVPDIGRLRQAPPISAMDGFLGFG